MTNVLTGRCAAALMAVATILVTVPLGASEAMKVKQWERDGTTVASVTAPPTSGLGWQTYFTQDVQQGTNLLFTYSCPASAPTPVGDSFSPTATAKVGLSLVGSFRQANKKNSWTWSINWPSGAPANSKIVFNIYCVQ